MQPAFKARLWSLQLHMLKSQILLLWVRCCRVLVHYRFDSVQGADAHLTQVLVLKLYKEYADSAFAVWAQHKVPDVASLFGGARAVEAAAAAAAGGSEVVGLGLGLSCEAAKTVLQEVLSARKQVGAAAVATSRQIPTMSCVPP